MTGDVLDSKFFFGIFNDLAEINILLKSKLVSCLDELTCLSSPK